MHRLARLLLALGCGACGGLEAHNGPPPIVPGEFDVFVEARLRRESAAVHDAPGCAAAWGQLGAVYDAQGVFDRALACYERAATLDPSDWRWPYFCGQAYQLVDGTQALRQFALAGELRDDYEPLELHLGLWLLNSEDLDGAERHFARALELEPGSLNARLGLTRVALARADSVAALRWVREAREIDPDESAVHAHMAQVERLRGNTDEAAREEALAAAGENRQRTHGFAPFADPARHEQLLLAGADLTWRRRRSEHWLASGQAAKAAAEWSEALELAAGVPAGVPSGASGEAAVQATRIAREEWSRAMARAGHAAEARARLAGWLEQDARWPEGWNQLGLLHAQGGAAPQAREAWEHALELEPGRADVANNLAGMYVQLGRVQEASALLERASTENPDHVPTRFNHALLLRRANRFAEALAELDFVLEREADHAEALYLRGEIHAIASRFADAERAFRATLAARPDHVAAHRDLGRALWQQRRYAEALAAWRAARAALGDASAVLTELAWGLATCPQATLRDGGEALALAQRLSAQSGDQDARLLDVLAAAQAETGDFGAAAETQKSSIELVERAASQRGAPGPEPLLAQLRGRLALYSSGQPYREGP